MNHTPVARKRATTRTSKPAKAPAPSPKGDGDVAENFMAGKALAANMLMKALAVNETGCTGDLLATHRGRGIPQDAFARDFFDAVHAQPQLADGFFAALSFALATTSAADLSEIVRAPSYLDCIGGPDTVYEEEAQAQRLASGGKPPAPPPQVTGASTPDPQVNLMRVKDSIYATLDKARSVAWLVGRMFDGDIDAEGRPPEARICESIQHLARLLERAVTIGNSPGGGSLGGEFFTELLEARGVSATLEAMVWADQLTIVASDGIMAALLEDLLNIIRRALAWLSPDQPLADPVLFFAEAKIPGRTAEGN